MSMVPTGSGKGPMTLPSGAPRSKSTPSIGRKKPKSTSSKSVKAGLHFPVGRIGRYLKDGRYAPRVGVKASVFLAAVLEYLCTEVLDLAANEAKDAGKGRIGPRHIQLAVRNDEELHTFLEKVTIASGGVIPTAPPPMPSRKAKSGGKSKAKGGSSSASGGARDAPVAAAEEVPS